MRTLAVGLSALPVVFAGTVALAVGRGGGTDPVAPPLQPVNSAAAGVLYRAGLSAETLTASGVTALQVGGMIAAALAQYDPLVLRSRDEARAHAAAEESRLSARARAGLATAEELAALTTARATLAEAEAALTAYIDAIRTAASASATPEQTALIRASHANRSWDLPAQYLVKARSQEGWVALREALDTKRISEVYGYEFPTSSRSSLAAVDAEPEIASAKSNLDANLFEVQTAWNVAASN
jgi:hypothetical protein